MKDLNETVLRNGKSIPTDCVKAFNEDWKQYLIEETFTVLNEAFDTSDKLKAINTLYALMSDY